MTVAPLRVLVADDEPLALRRLKLGVSQMPDVEIVGAASDGETALKMIRERRPDVVLLDIKMPGLTGLELIRQLSGDTAPAVIFVSAFGRFAVDAFDVAAVDYVLKPIEYERLHLAVDRARQALKERNASERIAEFQATIEQLRSEEPEPRPSYERELWVRHGREQVRLPVDAIEWVEAEREYVRVHAGARKYYLRGSLRALQAQLDPQTFVRVHRRFLVRRDRVAKLRREESGALFLHLASGAEVPVARRFRFAARRLSGHDA
jgi:DNA-binding LytR/AlgR family response regulator